MYNRRDFLKTSFIAGAGIIAAGSMPLHALAGNKEVVRLTILHTNDMHSHIEPFPENDPKHPGLGGMARRAALIKKVREQEENILLLDAGDVFQGTPYFNLYGGELEFKLMSEMKYDACTIGNHDFDNGLEGLAKMMPHANFPFLSANYDFSDTILNGKTSPYKTFTKNGLKIGVYGLGVELDGLVDKRLYGNTIYNDPIQVSKKISKLLKKDLNCDLVICLSHLGYKYKKTNVCDIDLAKASKYTDVIIGGHTHTFLNQPVRIKGKCRNEVLVCQAGWAGIQLGRIDISIELKTNKKQSSGLAYNLYKNNQFSQEKI